MASTCSAIGSAKFSSICSGTLPEQLIRNGPSHGILCKYSQRCPPHSDGETYQIAGHIPLLHGSWEEISNLPYRNDAEPFGAVALSTQQDV